MICAFKTSLVTANATLCQVKETEMKRSMCNHLIQMTEMKRSICNHLIQMTEMKRSMCNHLATSCIDYRRFRHPSLLTANHPHSPALPVAPLLTAQSTT